MPRSEGKPMSVKAMAKMSHGRARTYTEGFMRNRVYQASVATTKIEQMMYSWVSVSVLAPDSKDSWNDVADKSWPIEMMIVYRGQPRTLFCMKICSLVRLTSGG